MSVLIEPPLPANIIKVNPPDGGDQVTVVLGISGPQGPQGPVGPVGPPGPVSEGLAIALAVAL